MERVQKCVDTALFGQVCDYCDGGAIYKILAEVLNLLTYGIAALAVLGIVIAGIMYMTSAGDVARQTKAKNRLIEVAIGILAWGLLYAFLNFLIPGGVMSSTLDSSTTSCPVQTSQTPTPTTETPTTETPTTPTTETDPIAETPTTETPTTEGIEHGTRKFTMCNMTFDVVKIQVNGTRDDGSNNTGLKKFIQDKIVRYHIDQSDGRIYDLNGHYTSSTAQNGKCDKVSKNMAYDMYFDTITSDSCSSGRYTRGGFREVAGDSGFKQTYDALMEGKPVVHRVSINFHDRGTTQRHYAVIVGVKQGANREHLTNSDFLFLETFSGALWNNIPGVNGGYRSNGGSGCTTVTKQSRFPYDTYFYIPDSKSGDDRKDCGT